MEHDKDDLILGIRPVDRGTLRMMMGKEWSEDQVEDLCEELLSDAGNVTAFIQPQSAVEYLLAGAPIPDAVVFDLKYRTNTDEQVRHSLRALLNSSIAVVQVYTNDPIETAKTELEGLMSEFPTRLIEPKSKSDTNAEVLADAIRQQVDKSLSAKLAKELRRLALQAVEGVLINIDDLPETTLIQLLGGQPDEPQEGELVELLSVKVGEALTNSTDLAKALEAYMAERQIPADRRPLMVRSLAEIVVANAQESIRNSGGLLALAENWERAHLINAEAATPLDTKNSQRTRDFFQYRLYTSPPETDTHVLTGDIARISDGLNGGIALPDLYLVITPLCDLALFWYKTRGTLTLARMSPIDARGYEEIRGGGNKFQMSGSITATTPLILPSIRLASGAVSDYAIYPHDIALERVTLAEAVTPKRPLKYSDLNGRLARQCRISEPFLGGILDKIRSVLFRSGIPDFPASEKERITKVLADLKPAN
jgi:hypothetical protein